MVCNLTGVKSEPDAPDGERHHTLGFLGREGSVHLQGLEGSAHLQGLKCSAHQLRRLWPWKYWIYETVRQTIHVPHSNALCADFYIDYCSSKFLARERTRRWRRRAVTTQWWSEEPTLTLYFAMKCWVEHKKPPYAIVLFLLMTISLGPHSRMSTVIHPGLVQDAHG